jgi:S-adenosylmethionine hydrolase
LPLLTLTSDLGTSDPYVAGIKGRVISRCPDLRIVDITHEVKPFEPKSAAFFLRQVWKDFPDDTIHWIGLDAQRTSKPRNLIVFHHNQYFIGADDGLFALLFDQHPEFIFAIREGIGKEYNDEGIFSDMLLAATWLASGKELLDIATQQREIQSSVPLTAVETEDAIRAVVIHIDRFGNVILNVTRDAFERVGKFRTFELKFRRMERITRMSDAYSDVPIGERLCRFNEAGYLEIAMNQGNAAGLLGLDIDTAVQILFQSEEK